MFDDPEMTKYAMESLKELGALSLYIIIPTALNLAVIYVAQRSRRSSSNDTLGSEGIDTDRKMEQYSRG